MKKSKSMTKKIISSTLAGILLLGGCGSQTSQSGSNSNQTNNKVDANLTKLDFDEILKNVTIGFENNFNDSVLVSSAVSNAALKNQKITAIIELDGNCSIDNYLASNGYVSLPEYIDSKEGIENNNKMVTSQTNLAKSLLKAGLIDTVEGNYTVLMNGFYATTTYGRMDQIRSFAGVKEAFVSTQYEQPKLNSVTRNYTDIDSATGIYNNDTQYDGSGTIVAVLDSGFDYTHEVFQMNIERPAFSKDYIEGKLKDTVAYDLENGDLSIDDVYYSSKVPFMYDYANKKPDVYPLESDHGTHVSGIIGGESEMIKGIAPQTQFAWMKVFNDEDGGGDNADIVNALEDAVILGVDAINMSLGSIGGYSKIVIPTDEVNSLEEREARIYDLIRTQGISLITAAGNDFSSGYQSTYGTNTPTNPESGTISSPGSLDASLTVASINGTLDPYALINGQQDKSLFFVDASDSKQTEYKFIDHMFKVIDDKVKNGELSYNSDGTVDVDYTVISGYGIAANYIGKNVKDKIVVVKRGGGVTFEEKLLEAYSNGALGILVYNNVSGIIKMTVGDEIFIPVASISMDAGASLIAAGKNGKLRFSKDYYDGPFMSDFSSWGPLPDLKLKPEITAHGGNIYSSVLGGGYDLMSGTSMATPNTCGIVLVIRDYVKENWPTLTPLEVTNMVNQLLMSSAVICKNELDNPYSPRKQGAGLATLMNAVETNAYLYVPGQEKTKLELGDDKEKTGNYVCEFNVRNISSTAMTYDIGNYTMTETVTSDDKAVAEVSHMLNPSMNVEVGDGLTLSGTKVTVPANTDAKIKVTLQLSDEDKKYIDTKFINGMYVEGYVTLNCLNDSDTKKDINLSIPFLSFYGDWLKAPILDKTFYEVDADRANNSISEDDKTKADLYATTPYGKYDQFYILPLGGYVYDLSGGYDPIAATEDKAAISIDSDAITGLYSVYLGLLRGAKELTFTLTNVETGEVVYTKTTYNNRKATFYGSSGGTIPYADELNLEMFDSITGNPFANNTKFEIKMVATLDYENGDQVSNNVYSSTFYVDYEAPTVEGVDFVKEWDKGDKKYHYFTNLTVSDNRYVQSVRPCSIINNQLIMLTDNPIPVYQNEANTSTKVEFEITDYFDDIKISDFPNTVFFLIDDYAMNTTIYYVALNGADNKDLAFTTSQIEMDKNTIIDLNDYVNIENAMIDNFTWSSSSTSVAIVDNAKVYAIGKGITTITGRSENTYETSVRVRIKVIDNDSANLSSLEKIYYNSYETMFMFDDDYDNSKIARTGITDYMPQTNAFSLYPSESIKLNVNINPWYYDKSKVSIVYKSSNSEYVSVDEDGVVVALKETKTPITIRATAYVDGKETIFTATTTVEVKDPFVVTGIMLMTYKGFGGDVIIPDDKGIQYIGEYAFSHYVYDGVDSEGVAIRKPVGNDTITSVTIPAGVKYIREAAFKNLTALETVTMPVELTDVYTSAFEGCTSLKSINLNNVKKIENFAFKGCSSLSNVNTPNATVGNDLSSVVTIGIQAFEGTALTKVDLPSARYIGFNAFANITSLKEIKLYELTGSNVSMFKNSSVENLTISQSDVARRQFIESASLSSVTFTNPNLTINQFAFEGCSSLSAINFENTTSLVIGKRAFANTNIETLTLPSCDVYLNDESFANSHLKSLVLSEGTILHINGTPFIENDEFASVSITGSNSNYSVNNNVLYNASGDTIILVPSANAITIPSTVATIGYGAFIGNTAKSIVIPSNVTKIENFAFAYSKIESAQFESENVELGSYLFYYATNLKEVNNIDKLTSIPSYTFSNTALETINVGDNVTIGYGAFAEIKTLKSAYVGENATIGDYAFYDSFTKDAVVTLTTGEVGNFAFAKANMSTIAIDKISTIGENAFVQANNITSIDLSNATSIGSSAFANMNKLTNVILSANLTTIAASTFNNDKVLASVAGSSLTDINNYAFYNCSNLSEINLENVKYIGDYAFANDLYLDDKQSKKVTTALTTINLSSLETLGKYAFYANTSLEVVESFSSKVKEIPESAFYSNEALKTIDLSNVESIGDHAFYLDSSLGTVNLQNVKTIADYAFTDSGVNSLDLANCTTIGVYAFYDTPIRHLTFPVVESIGEGAFYSIFANTVDLPTSLKHIGSLAFSSNTNILAYTHDNADTFQNDNYWLIEDGVLYTFIGNSNSLQLSAYPMGNKRTTYTVKEGTTRIDTCAFYSNSSYFPLEEVILPNTLKTIGDAAFYGCDNLKTYRFNSSIAPELECSYNSSLQNYLYSLQSTTPVLDGLYQITQGTIYNMYFYLYPYYYANFVDYVGMIDTLTMYYPSNGKGYDSWIYAHYFTNKEVASAVADATTLNAMNALKTLSSINKATSANKDEIISVYDTYCLVSDPEQLALLDTDLVNHMLDLYDQVTEMKYPTLSADKVGDLVGTYSAKNDNGIYTLVINEDGTGTFTYAGNTYSFNKVRMNGDSYLVNFANKNFNFVKTGADTIVFTYYIDDITLTRGAISEDPNPGEQTSDNTSDSSNENPGETHKKGCKGSAAASSALFISLGALAICLKKRKTTIGGNANE